MTGDAEPTRARTWDTMPGSTDEPVRYVTRGWAGRPLRSSTSMVMTLPWPAKSIMVARKCALAPKAVPVSTITAGRIVWTSSW